ncbi:class A beta-lactamase [Deminuibacter soli]|uniref:Beta-lactamase n=1 Tax=Deminuibacter soli TaxID=2291815 RepID=A0A3E1NF23_9BACT|nr:class A beta-lactamase [Deminuibacter soli]RFM26477.1 serine hydrolase [Deminuibacter soli]
MLHNLLTKRTALLLLLSLSASLLHAQQLLNHTIAQFAQRSQGKTGVFAQVLETGDTAGFYATDRFPMQSVYKVPIAMAILAQVDKGKWQLSDSILVLPSDLLKTGHSPITDEHPQGNVKITLADLLQLAVGESDGTASDVLLRILGGPQKVKKYLHHIGVKHVAVANTEKEIQGEWEVQYSNHATPEAIGKLLRTLYTKDALSLPSRDILLKWMTESTPGAARIKGLLPPGTPVAHKTGTSATNKDGLTAATNDAGIITMPNGHHLVVVVLVSNSPADTPTRENVIASITKTLWDTWSR